MSDALRDRLQHSLGTSYALERELGGGGMSRVFVAHDVTLGRDVVVKVLPPEAAAGVSAERFRREIMLAARLQHPHIVPLLSAGDMEGVPYFTMPLVDGESLRARLARQGEMPVHEALRTLREVASALAYAHAHGVVHRDVKPDNVLLSGDAAMVTDFGVAKAISASADAAHGGATSLGIALGTPAYMAPEQASADPSTDHRADVYAFGVLAYELLTGQPPFAGRPPQALLAAHVTEAPEPIQKRRATIPPALAALVMRCLEKRPADRPQSAAEIVQSLDAITTPSGGTAPTTTFGVTDTARSRRQRVMLFATAVAVVAAAVTLAVRGAMRGSTESPSKSLAVLPFTTARGDSAQLYFAEGMADELTTSLGSVTGLRVASRSAAFALAHKLASATDVGRELHVGAVLEGTVRRAGSRIRVTAQLTNVADGISIWSDAFDRDTGDVFTMQDELARRITDALHQKLALSTASTVVTHRGTQSQDAYDLYLRGRYFWLRRGAASLDSAARYFRAAIARDSAFARAWAGLATAEVVMPYFASLTNASRDSVFDASARDARHALALDPSLADALTVVGQDQTRHWQWSAADSTYQRALALEPTNPTVHHWYAELLYSVGRMPESLAQYREAARLDPTSTVIESETALAHYLMTHWDEAIARGRRSFVMDSTIPLFDNFVGAFLFRGMPDSTLAYSMRAQLALGGPPSPYRPLALERLGRHADATRAAEEIEAFVSRGGPAYNAAVARAALGDRDRAIAWLARSVDAHEEFLASGGIACEPMFDPLRNDPRFAALLVRMHLGVCIRR